MPRRPLIAALLLAAVAAPAAAAPAGAPRDLGGLALGMSLDDARVQAVALGRPFNGCDTLVATKDDGRPLVTLCSHQGLAKGTELDVGKTDVQVWADGSGTLFAIRTSTPISCVPEEQVAVVRDIQARYEGFVQWRPAWTWSGSDGVTALDVEMKNAEAPCAVVTEIRTEATHEAVAAALRAEFE